MCSLLTKDTFLLLTGLFAEEGFHFTDELLYFDNKVEIKIIDSVLSARLIWAAAVQCMYLYAAETVSFYSNQHDQSG